MRTVFLLFDSLNRHMLGPYGSTHLETPNFDRLATRSATFERHFVGSMPCMPARRDILTGRMSFLHRSWGPIEPFDNTFTRMLAAQKGVYSHLATDHFHYWEDGGATYHNRYDSYDLIRGQEGDLWHPVVAPDHAALAKEFHPAQFSDVRRNYKRQNMVNRARIDEDSFPSALTVDAGLAFIETNKSADDWFLQIECFDPHEPFQAPQRFRDLFPTGWTGPTRDWPPYNRLSEEDDEADELRANYLACMAHCDALLGRVLDRFDADDLWKDTALVVTTDHGYLLGEHDFWAKNRMHLYDELANIPLFLHDPRRPSPGRRIDALSQTPDLCATFLDLHGGTAAPEMRAQSLIPLLDGGAGHDAVIYGFFGGAVNVTDGDYTYFRMPQDLATQEIFQYTLMPTHIFDFFHPDELKAATLHDPLSFTKGQPVLRMPVSPASAMFTPYGPGAILEEDTRLYDRHADPDQLATLNDPQAEARMTAKLARCMAALDAPPEAWQRLEIAAP